MRPGNHQVLSTNIVMDVGKFRNYFYEKSTEGILNKVIFKFFSLVSEL